MGGFMILFFPEKDGVHIKEIAKIHGVPAEIVEKHYKVMLKGIENEVRNTMEN